MIDVDVIILPESGDALVFWPDGRAIRIRPDGAIFPPMPSLMRLCLEVESRAAQRPHFTVE